MTIAEIKGLLHQLEIFPQKKMGQNFLISDEIIRRIVERVIKLKPASLIEVGPGLGSITRPLLAQFPDLQLLELDRNLVSYWQNQLPGKVQSIIQADALQWDWRPILQSVGPRVLVSNLPYQISSSIVIDRTLDETPLDAMVLMFQAEVAQKIRMDDEKSSLLSALVRANWRVSSLIKAAPGCFFPAPKVSSEVLVFEQLADKPVQNRKSFFRLLKASFLHPRKLLASNLAEGLRLSKVDLQASLVVMGVRADVRAENMTFAQFTELAKKLQMN